MRKIMLLCIVLLFLTGVRASSFDAIELFISAENSVSLSTTGKLFRLNMSSGAINYDHLNRAVTAGGIYIAYDELNRVIKIGDILVSYDQSSRVIQIGDTKICYDISSRVVKIGDAKISYDALGRVVNIAGKTPANIRFATIPGQT